MSNEPVDVLVIGGGSAGLAAARAAKRRGFSVAVAEATRLGGECLWWTCLPTKALLESAHAYYHASHCERFGCVSGDLHLDYDRVLAERKADMARFTKPMSEMLLSDEGIGYYHGKASFLSAHEVRAGEHVIQAENIVIAVGARPVIPPIPGLDTVKYLTYMHAINLPKVPSSLVIIGGGPVGCEFAQIFRRFGANVTMIERFPLLLNLDDVDISTLARSVLEAEGVRILTETTVLGVTTAEEKKVVTVSTHQGTEQLPCDEVLVVTGRRPHLDGLNLSVTGIHVEQGHPVLRDTLQTSVPHIWVCGDASGGAQYRHLSEYQGEHVGNNIGAPTPQPIDERVIPHVTFLSPELASVGLTEEQAISNYDIVVETLSLELSDRALLMQQTQGFIKLVVNRHDGQILGGHLAGPYAGDTIHEIALAMFAHIPVGVLAEMPRVYPSVYEPLRHVAKAAKAQCKVK